MVVDDALLDLEWVMHLMLAAQVGCGGVGVSLGTKRL